MTTSTPTLGLRLVKLADDEAVLVVSGDDRHFVTALAGRVTCTCRRGDCVYVEAARKIFEAEKGER